MGNVTATTRNGLNVNYKFGYIPMTYSTKFQLGEAQEQLVWLKSEKGLRFLNHDIKSAALDDSNVQ